MIETVCQISRPYCFISSINKSFLQVSIFNKSTLYNVGSSSTFSSSSSNSATPDTAISMSLRSPAVPFARYPYKITFFASYSLQRSTTRLITSSAFIYPPLLSAVSLTLSAFVAIFVKRALQRFFHKNNRTNQSQNLNRFDDKRYCPYYIFTRFCKRNLNENRRHQQYDA